MKTLIIDRDSRGVASVALNRPEIHNAFNDQMITELTEVFVQMGSDPDVQVIVLSGMGKSFCAGADLNWMKRMKDYTQEENYRDSEALSKMLQTINFCPVPVIGKVHGAALGGGVGLTACCDIVVAEEGCKFGLTEVRLGLLPAVISPFVMAKIGPSQSRHLFLTGERFESPRALSLGLIHKVSLERYFTQDIEAIVEQILGNGPRATKLAKQLCFDVHHLSTESDFSHVEKLTCELISKVRVSAEGQEGMNALLEKRGPVWPK